ncbi:hypothetical protein PR202_gb06783 [Eleusine coracana subsp. coracana]|uniref:BHLH domain-containing protein n=1 Tax=Eleusine coracana subsp. coracana TaxID=191504 RepID=A0AAV5EBC9_ELECO|nr:hypothetical protein QOZ80_2BG0161890 [Eleusine coracana subsp. coracana]GJN19501.1 hypothetical protein PR202_gb06783 [Eleusine coracana subsp. coracana]
MGDGGMCELLVNGRCEDLFSIIETWEECINGGVPGGAAAAAASAPASAAFISHQNCTGGSSVIDAGGASRPTTTTGNGRRRSSSVADDEQAIDGGAPPVQKKQKVPAASQDAVADDGAAKISHIAVERNRRKQMNEHLAVLRSLMPCFYVKRGDQASIIGGVVEYIKELQQVLRSLEAKKHRKAYADQVLSPRPTGASPRPLIIKSTPPLSPRVSVPISPRTPTRPGSPYLMPSSGGGRPPHPAAAAAAAAYMTSTASSSSTSSHDQQQQQHYSSLAQTPTTTYLPTLDSIVTELAAQHGARPALPDVRVEFAGPNLVLKTASRRAPGQALKIIAALESLSLEILHVSVSTVDDTMVHSFTIKIGIECELSAEELVQEIQRTFL